MLNLYTPQTICSTQHRYKTFIEFTYYYPNHRVILINNPLSTSIIHIHCHFHYPRPLSTSIIHVHYPRPLSTSIIRVHYYLRLLLPTSIIPVQYPRPLSTSNIHVHYYPRPLSPSIIQVHYPRPLSPSIIHVHHLRLLLVAFFYHSESDVKSITISPTFVYFTEHFSSFCSGFSFLIVTDRIRSSSSFPSSSLQSS